MLQSNELWQNDQITFMCFSLVLRKHSHSKKNLVFFVSRHIRDSKYEQFPKKKRMDFSFCPVIFTIPANGKFQLKRLQKNVNQ